MPEARVGREDIQAACRRFARSILRSFTLPAAVVTDKVSAEFKDGMLKVHLPKDTKGGTKVDIKVS